MQKLISKIFILLTLFSYTLYGCTICTIYSPETQVSIDIHADDKKIYDAKVTWVLSKEFTDQLKLIYDSNQNNNLDKNELEPIEESIIDYVKPKNSLAHISYDKVVNKDSSKKINVKEYKTFVKNSRLHFYYDITLNYDVIKDNALYIKIDDDEKFFILLLAKDGIKFNAPFKYEQVVDKKSAIFYINANVKTQELKTIEKLEEVVIKKKELEESSSLTKESQQVEKTENKDEGLLANYSKKVKEYLVKIERGDDYALFVLLFISFLYGIIHALGPGHGKSLAFSYFASNKSSFIKAFWVSQASAFIHIVGALVLVMVSVFLLQSMLNNFVNDSVEILTKVSAIMIMLLAAYILYNKLTNKPHSCSACCSDHSHEPTNTTSAWSTTKPVNTTSLKPNFMKKDLYFVLTAGLIPCPGTVVLFIYAFILKTYFAVILASIFISLGMGLVIFASSFLGVSVHKLSERSQKLTNVLEILAPIVMFILGILLFLNAEVL